MAHPQVARVAQTTSPSPGALAQPDWLWNDLSSEPSARFNASNVYDSTHGTELLFGGQTSSSAYLGDVDSYNGTSWSTLTTTGTAPSARASSAAAYDPVHNDMVVFGGYNGSGVVGGTFTFDAATKVWTPKTGTTQPAARWGASMAWDPNLGTSGEIVLFGGYANFGHTLRDMYAFDGSNWTPLSPSGSLPAPRGSAGLVFDPNLPVSSSSPAGQLVLFGGNEQTSPTCTSSCAFAPGNDTWVFDGTSWSQWTLQTTGLPSARSGFGMAYDPLAGQIVMFGGTSGSTYNGETWRFDGSRWIQEQGIASPSGRGFMQMMITANGSGYIYGGTSDGATGLAQQWRFERRIPSVTVAPTSTTVTSYAVGQSVGFNVSFGNVGPIPLSLVNAVATLPAGLAVSPSAVVNNSTGLPCTPTSTPSCTVSATTPTITVSGTELPKTSSLSLTVYATVASLTSGANAYNCLASIGLPAANNPSGYASQVLADRPAEYYRLDDATSGGTAQNLGSGGTTFNGTYSSGGVTSVTPTAPGPTGDNDKSISLDGTGYATFGSTSHPYQPSSNGMTVEAWVKPAPVNGTSNVGYFSPIVDLATDTSDTKQIFIGRNATADVLQATVTTTGGGVNFTVGNALQPNVWQLVAMTISTAGSHTTVTMYRDGLPIGTGTSNDPFDTTDRGYADIGRDPAGGVSKYQGGIDDVAIYPKALDATRLLAHYQAATTTAAGETTATATGIVARDYHLVTDANYPIAYYRLDDPVGSSTAAPAFPSAATGTASSGVTFGAPGLLTNDPNTAASFNGTSGYVTTANPTASDNTFSIDAWFKATTVSSPQVIVGTSNVTPTGTAANYIPNIYIGADGKLRGEIWDMAVNPLVDPTALSANVTYHVVLTSTLNHEYLYLGTADSTSLTAVDDRAMTPSAVSALTYATIGTGYAGGTWTSSTNGSLNAGWGNYFHGTIDEVALYPNSLDNASINYAQAAGVGVPGYGQNTAATLLGSGTGGSAPLTVCDTGLGLEPWWTYLSKPVGATSTAQVNVANGNLVVSGTDSTPVQAHGHLDLVLHRTYNSMDSGLVAAPGSIGEGWQLSVGQSDALAGVGVTATGLEVPSASGVVNQITAPQDVTLVDRDGTRHVFTPASTPNLNVTSVLGGALSALTPVAMTLHSLGLDTGTHPYTTICADQAYSPPPGVHLGLWRYVAVGGTGSSVCSPSSYATTPAPVVVGYATERPDRLRTEFNALGQTISMTDGAGATLDYAYTYSTYLVGNVPSVPGSLEAVYDANGGSCTVTSTAGQPTVSGGCRNITFNYATSNQIKVTDSAGRVTIYKETTGSLNNGLSPLTTFLTEVDNPDGTKLTYTYQNLASASCGASQGQLCSVKDEDSHTTVFAYSPPSGSPALGLNQVTGITDRRGFPTTLTYSHSSTDEIDLANKTGTSSTDRETVYAGIDANGRVGQIYSGARGVSPSTALRNSTYFWDATSSGGSCEQSSMSSTPGDADYDPNIGRDNDLCEVVAAGSSNPSSGISTPNADATYTYDDAGELLATASASGRSSGQPTNPATGATVTSASSYHRQWTYQDGSTGTGNESIAVNGSDVLSVSTPSASNADGPVLFTLDDQTQSLSGRGAADATNWQQYLTTYTVDDQVTSAPNTSPSGGTCTSTGAVTGNTGLVCQQSHDFGPVGAGSPPVATTVNRYDPNGQLTSRLTPKANADGGNPYTYAYYASGTTDLSGTSPANGWLASVTDPSGKFVAFGYDAAGNVVRSWDRDATAGQSTASYPGTVSTPGPGAFAQTLYATGSTSTAIANPWRWVQSTKDPAGATTTDTTDGLGDVLSTTTANGGTSYASFDEDGNQFRAVDAVQGSNTSNTATYTTYDAFGDPDSVTSPNQAAADATAGHAVPSPMAIHTDGTWKDLLSDAYAASSLSTYDAAGERVSTTTLRGASSSVPTPSGNCRVTTSADNPALATGQVVCTATASYDTLGNTVATEDATNAVSSTGFDALSRAFVTVAPSNGTTTPTTYTNLDPDGHAVDACAPRQMTDGSGTCGASSVYATHTSYDLAGQPITVVNHRDSSTALTTTMVHDADGNTTETCRPRQVTDGGGGCGSSSGYATITTYNDLDRATATATPRTGSLTIHTYNVHDPSGDVIASVADGAATDNAAGTGTGKNYRITGYSYDTDHRLLDTVTGLQVATADPTPDTDTNRTSINTALGAALADANGEINVRTRNVYDGDGNIVEVYDARAFASSVTSPDDQFRVTTAYDADDRPIDQYTPRFGSSLTDPNSDSTQAAQCPTNPSGLPSGEAYPSGTHVCATGVSYDANGNVHVADLPAFFGGDTNATDTSTYTADDLLQSVSGPDPSNNGSQTTVTAHHYDADARQLTTTDANGLTDCTIYNPDGSTSAQLTDAGSTCSTTTHDESYSYDADGDQTLDQLNNVTVDGTSMNLPTTTTYTADDLKQAVSTPRTATTSNTTQYTYDADGSVASVTSPDAVATDTANPRGLPTVSTYTQDDLLAATYTPIDAQTGDHATWRAVSYSYDPEGDKTQTATNKVTATTTGSTDPTTATVANPPTDNGGSQSFSYFPDSRLNTQSGRNNGGSLTETITDLYNPAGDLTSSVDTEPALGSGSTATAGYTDTLSASYYADGLIRNTTDSSGRVTTASYDGAGALTQRSTNATGSTTSTSFGYDDADLPTSETSGSAGNYTWTYDAGGRAHQQVAPNSDTTTWAYTPGDNTTHLVTVTNGSTTIAQDCYGYDEAFRVLDQSSSTTISQPSTGCDTTHSDPDLYQYSYHASGAVKAFTNGTESPISYTYDHDLNRLTASDPANNAETYTYNADDSIANATLAIDGSGTRTYGYDADGRLNTDGCTDYTYDGFDRQLSTTKHSGAPTPCASVPTVTYSYDGQDRQTSSNPASGSTTFVGYNLLTQTVDSETTGTGGTPPLTLYAFGTDGTPLASTHTGGGAPPNGTQQLIDAGNGSIGDVIDADGTTRCEQRYDPFGNTDGDSAASMSDPCTASNTASTLGYQSTRTDQSTGTQQYGSRTYTPATGTFTTPDDYRTGSPNQDLSVKTDPLTENTYNYVNGDPVNLDDPNGHDPCVKNGVVEGGGCYHEGIGGAETYGNGPKSQPHAIVSPAVISPTNNVKIGVTVNKAIALAAGQACKQNAQTESGCAYGGNTTSQQLQCAGEALRLDYLVEQGDEQVLSFDTSIRDAYACRGMAFFPAGIPAPQVNHYSGLEQLALGGIGLLFDDPAVGADDVGVTGDVASSSGSVSSQVDDLMAEIKAIAGEHGFDQVSAFGRGYLWENKAANLGLQTPEQLADVQARGFTQSQIATIRDAYAKIDEVSTAGGNTNPSAGYRANLMQYYLDNWGD